MTERSGEGGRASLTIAVQPDRLRHKNGEWQSFSDRWLELCAQRGIAAREVNVFAPDDLLSQLTGCDAFMWRFGYSGASRQLAQRLLPAIEHALGIPVFPSWKTAWHFEDKVAQRYLLEAAGIPTPRTWVHWSLESALDFCRRASYPLVIKLSHGFQSRNVLLVGSCKDASDTARRMFGSGLSRLERRGVISRALRRPIGAARVLLRRPAFSDSTPDDLQHGYFYAQEFLPGNAFDTRVTVIGSRAFAFRRFNRPDDFRASGSGLIDWDPSSVDEEMIRLAWRVARCLGTQSVAVDGLFRGTERVIAEISYTYASWALRDCPGHWLLEGEPEDGRLSWIPGRLRPEDAIFDDLVERIAARPRDAVDSAAQAQRSLRTGIHH